jgi:hypothetical protein
MQDDTAIHLFKEQLENEGKKLESLHELKKRGELLTWWYFTVLSKFLLNFYYLYYSPY